MSEVKSNKKIRVKVLRSTVAEGQVIVEGDVAEISEIAFRVLGRMKKVELIEDETGDPAGGDAGGDPAGGDAGGDPAGGDAGGDPAGKTKKEKKGSRK